MFANPLRANDARNELWAIKWNPRRQTALEFRQQFLSLAHEAGMDNFPTLIQIYKHALPSGIRMEIALQHPSPGEDLAQWMTRVYERDLQWRSERGNEPQEKLRLNMGNPWSDPHPYPWICPSQKPIHTCHGYGRQNTHTHG